MNITLVDSQAALKQKTGSNVMVRGPAYKRDIGDLRESPSLTVLAFRVQLWVRS